MLARLFGLFGIVLGAAYFVEGVAFINLLPFALSQGAREIFITYALFVTWDFLFGTCLVVAGIGVFLLKEWARIAWLGLVPALVLVHFGIIVVNELFGGGVSAMYYVWTAMLVAIAALSAWYLTRPRIRARFSRQKPEPLTEH